jgi:glucose-6-phosphate dehydrogenase assembly protein OpcA
MVAQQDLIELARWDESPTSAESIAAAVLKIWQRAGASRPEADGHAPEAGVVRTRVANFVAFATSPEQADQADRVLEELAIRHPVRSLLIVLDGGGEGQDLGASLRVYCRPLAERRVCFERIRIAAGAGQLPQLAGVITQLLVPDLPRILWWLGDPPFDQAEFRDFVDLAEVMIVDSGECELQLDGLVALSEAASKWSGDRVISDLNWNRLADWRELIAQFFDCSTSRSLLEGIERVRIEVCKDAGDTCTSVQALLVAGWLGSRLGWELQEASQAAGEIQIDMQSASRSIGISIEPVERSAGPPGWVTAINIETSGSDGPVKFSLQASDGEGHGTATVESTGGQVSCRGFALEDRSDVALVEDELQAIGRERALHDALAAAGLIARRLTA